MKKATCVPTPSDIMGFALNTVDAPIEGIVLDINEESAASQSMLARLQNPCHSDPAKAGGGILTQV